MIRIHSDAYSMCMLYVCLVCLIHDMHLLLMSHSIVIQLYAVLNVCRNQKRWIMNYVLVINAVFVRIKHQPVHMYIIVVNTITLYAMHTVQIILYCNIQLHTQ